MYMVITFKQMVQLILINAGLQLIIGSILAVLKILDTIRKDKKLKHERTKAEEELAKAEQELNDFVESRKKKRIIGFQSDTIMNNNNGKERS